VESLALLVALIVAPAMFGGPISLLLTLWRPEHISKLRRTIILFLAFSSALIGIYLIVGNISRGALIIGFMGLATGAIASWRVLKLNSNK
jgi:disulfide bond formation protein DsbB